LKENAVLRLYDNRVSGNCYKVRLLLAHLGRAYEPIDVDVVDRDRRRAQIAEKAPFDRIPVLELEDGRRIAESNAILWWLSDGTPYLPEDPWDRIQVLQWLFFEQNQLEPSVAVARYWSFILERAAEYEQALSIRQRSGRAALAAMNDHLAEHDFLTASGYTIADISLFGYAHVADEAGIAVSDFEHVAAWLDRVRAQPGFVPM
jgi:glutathione S-transferase